MTYPATEVARLGQYNSNPVSDGNPRGLANYGNVTNFPLALSDIVAVATWINTDIAPIADLETDIETIVNNITAVTALGALDSEITSLGAITSEIEALGAVADDVAALAEEIAAISGVNGELAAVVGVNGALAAVNAVNAALSAINAVYGALADIAILAPRATDMALLADIEDGTTATGAITTVAAAATAVQNVSANIDDVNTTATNIADVNTVAGLASEIVALEEIADAISSVYTNISVVSNVSANMDDIEGAVQAASHAEAARDAARRVTRYMAFDNATTDSDPGNGQFRFSFNISTAAANDTGTLYIDLQDSAATDLTGWIDSWDDVVNDTARGEVTMVNAADPSINVTFQVTGSVVTASGYRKVPVKVLARGGSFADEAEFTIDFRAYGNDGSDGAGSGNVNSTGSINSGNIVKYADGTGNLIEDSGVSITDFATAEQGGKADSAVQPDDIATLFDTAEDTLDDITAGSTNVHFTSSEKSKLSGIEASADVTDAANVGAALAGASTKGTPVDADGVWITDSAASNAPKRTLWSAIKSTLKTYFDTLYAAVSHTHAFSAITGKPTTIDGYGITDGLEAANNLSELTNKSTALTNLGLTATAAELNKLDGVTATTAELNYVDGVTSAIQTQLDAKQAYDADTAKTDVVQEWEAAQRSDITSLSVVSGDIDWTLASSNDFAVTLTANAELQLPSDIATHVGQNGTMLIKQDGTGSRTFAVVSGFSVLNSDTLPDVLPAANAKTLLSYRVISTTEIVIAMGGVGDGL